MSFPSGNARSWSEIVAHYKSLAGPPWAAAMERLVSRLHDEGYIEAGLHGTTSMFDLLVGPASDVLNNPHLRVSPTATDVRFTYEDGSQPAWTVAVAFDELYDRVERVLVKRARWFQKNSRPPES